jgi:hypothetical protein
MSELKIVECPRDAMQGMHAFVPTEAKITYINHLLDLTKHNYLRLFNRLFAAEKRNQQYCG